MFCSLHCVKHGDLMETINTMIQLKGSGCDHSHSYREPAWVRLWSDLQLIMVFHSELCQLTSELHSHPAAVTHFQPSQQLLDHLTDVLPHTQSCCLDPARPAFLQRRRTDPPAVQVKGILLTEKQDWRHFSVKCSAVLTGEAVTSLM